ncbi:MAG TPA: ATP-binding protein [Spirochaetia bacterium]|nr:ATP-binding protein [Spirochaetia bacterium]
MRLRTKLLAGILGTLLLQIAVTGTFTLSSFLSTTRLSMETALHRDWDRARAYLEEMKHRLYTDLFQLSFILEEGKAADASAGYIRSLMHHFVSLASVDRIVLVDGRGAVVADERAGLPQDDTLPISMLNTQDFRFPRNLFVTASDGRGTLRLYLVTGTAVQRPGASPWHIYIVTDIDRGLVAEILEKTGTNVAFFAGNVPIVFSDEFQSFPSLGPTSAAPYGPSPAPQPAIRFGDQPYSMYSSPLSADLRDKLYLVSLRSSLPEQLYIKSVLFSYLTAFLITLAASIFLAAGVTSLAVSPFTRLSQWLHRYMDTGQVGKLDIRSRDETGFLAGAFHAMVSTMIAEKRTVSDQLEQIRQLAAYNERIMNGIRAAIVVVDAQGAIEFCNSYFAELTCEEREGLRGQDFRQRVSRIFTLRDGAPAEGAFSFEREAVIEGLSLTRPDAGVLHFTAKLSPMGLSGNRKGSLVVLEDVTASERFWAGVTIADRVTSMGILSAGMAHEINNPLGSILSHVNYLKAVEKGSEKLDSLFWIESETNRIAAIIQRIRAYSAPATDGEHTADLNLVASQTLDLLRFTLEKRKLDVSSNLAQDLAYVDCPPDELKQVVLNIVLNAFEACSDGGAVCIRTGRGSNGTAVLSVADNGVGIAPENMKNIFDPFFTTKNASQGNGLGLSICYAIVKRCGGDIRIESRPGAGTEVEVTLNVHEHPHRG